MTPKNLAIRIAAGTAGVVALLMGGVTVANAATTSTTAPSSDSAVTTPKDAPKDGNCPHDKADAATSSSDSGSSNSSSS